MPQLYIPQNNAGRMKGKTGQENLGGYSLDVLLLNHYEDDVTCGSQYIETGGYGKKEGIHLFTFSIGFSLLVV